MNTKHTFHIHHVMLIIAQSSDYCTVRHTFLYALTAFSDTIALG